MISKDLKIILTSFFIVLVLLLASFMPLHANTTPTQTDAPGKYAVIIVGCYGTGNPSQTIEETEAYRIQHYEWFLNDAQKMYNVLRDQYGYDNKHIQVLIRGLKILGSSI